MVSIANDARQCVVFFGQPSEATGKIEYPGTGFSSPALLAKCACTTSSRVGTSLNSFARAIIYASTSRERIASAA
jgi:hypothetical protein